MEKKHWWSPLILGILVLALGIVILIFPQASYLTMTLLFGIVIALSGIMYIGLSFSKEIKGRGWLIVSGIVEIFLGIFLALSPAISALVIPIVLGFWLLFKGFTLIGMGYSLSSIKGSGWGWTIFSAILLILCGAIILLQPVFYGIEAVILWSGVSFIIGGCTLMNYAFKLKDLNDDYIEA